MSKRYTIRALIFVSASFMLWFLYAIINKTTPQLIHDVLHAEPNKNILTYWVNILYPRLQTEKWRLDEYFFILKSQQLLWRNTIVLNIVLLLGIYWKVIKASFTNQWNILFDVSISKTYLNKYITPLLYTCLLVVVYDGIIEFTDLSYFKAFYNPVGIGKILLPIFPSMLILWSIYIILIGSIFTVILLPHKWISASVAVFFFLLYQILLAGFNKYDHGYTTLTYAMLVYPFVLYEQEKSSATQSKSWGIVLIQVLICLSYFYGGMEKILISGWDWIALNNLQQHLLIHQTQLGIALSKYPIVCKALSLGVILFQCGFILLPYQPKAKYILLPIGFIFHMSTWVLLDAGGIINPWWWMYLFFLFPLQPLETKSNPVVQ